MKQDLYNDPKEVKKGFDLQVTFRDEKTGVVTHTDPYVLRVVSGTKYWERPAGSGNIFNAKGEAIGRWEKNAFVPNAKHVAYAPPETRDQKLAREIAETKSQNEVLMKELESLRAEQKKKQGS